MKRFREIFGIILIKSYLINFTLENKYIYIYRMYSKIINPDTGLKVNIGSRLGKTILRNYLSVLSGGADPTPERIPPLEIADTTGAGIGRHHIEFVVRRFLPLYNDGSREDDIEEIIDIIYDILRTFDDTGEVEDIWYVMRGPGDDWDPDQPPGDDNFIKLPGVISSCLEKLNIRWRGGSQKAEALQTRWTST